MNCKRCGKPLPSEGVTCKFCGMLMSNDEINTMRKNSIKEDKRLRMLQEKYASNKQDDYEKPKENKLLGIIFITIVLLILIVITIIVNVMN